MASDKWLWLYSNGDLDEEPELWWRLGACTRCGKCCERAGGIIRYCLSREEGYNGPQPDASVPRLPDWEKGKPIVAENWEGFWTWWQQMEPAEKIGGCDQYDGHSTCKVFGTDDWPEICQKWPLFPNELENYPDCGFSFERG